MLRSRVVVVVALIALVALSASKGRAVADGTPLTSVVTQHVFGAAVGVGNTLMEHDGTVNFAVRTDVSEATIPLSRMDPDATVVQAFLVWAGTFNNGLGVPLDRSVDFHLPNGTIINDLSVDVAQPGETLSPLNRCVSRNHNIGGQVQPMFECRREVTSLLQGLGAGGAVGTYGVDDVNLEPGDCNNDPNRCQAAFGGWAIVVLWESPTESVKRDLVVFDGFFALDEQGTSGFGGGFSSGIGPAFQMDGFTIGPTADGEITFLAWEGDAQLGVPPQNLPGNPNRCNDGHCEDFIQIRTNGNPTFRKLSDAANRAGNLMNGSDNNGGVHPGVDIDTFDIGPSGLNVLRSGDTQLSLQPGSGDGVADDGSGGSGELFLLGMTFLSVETFSPRFLNTFTEKVVLEPVAGAGETLHYLLRVENNGSAAATNTLIRDQLPAGVTYVPGSTTNTCGVGSADTGGTSPVLRGAGLNVGSLAVNARCEVRFNVTVDDDVADGTTLENFFTVAADGVPPILIGPATTVIQAAEIGQPTKTVSVVGGGEPSVGSTLTYTIRVPNTGTRNAPGVSVVDAIPAQLENLQIVSFPAGASNNSTATQVKIDNIAINAGASADIVFTARVKSGVATGTSIANQGTITQSSLPAPLVTDDPATAAPRDPTTIVTASGVSLVGSSKTAVDQNGGRFQPGDVVLFTVHVNKTGSASTVVNLSDALPLHVSGCAVVSAPAGGFANCGAGGANGTGQVTGAVAIAGVGGGDFVFSATLDADAPDGFSLVNSATLTPVIDPSFAVTVTSAPLAVFSRPDFTTSSKVVLDVNGGQARPGDALDYTITVVNSGTAAATNVVVTDVVPAFLTGVVVLDGGTFASGTATWTLASLAAGASATLHVNASIAPLTPDGTIIANRARIHADAPAADFTTAPAPARVTVRASPTLTAQKTVADLNAPPFRPGDTVRYTITLRNGGDGVATNVTVRDTIDPSFEAAVTNAGGRVVGGDVVFDASTVAALSSLAPGATVTLTFDARLLPVITNGTVVANQARTTADQVAAPVSSDDPATAANNDPTRFTVTSQARLSVKKTFVDENGGATLPGDTVTYTLTVDDTGDAPAVNVALTDVLDARLTFVSSPDGATLAGNTVTFPPIASIVPGAGAGGSRSLRFTARIASGLANGTTIDNQASASSATAPSTVSDDPNTVAALDPTRITIVSRPVLDTFRKSVVDVDGDGRFEPGDRVRYTIVVENTGSEDAQNVVVTDALPLELEAAAADHGGVITGGAGPGASVTWTLGTVAAGAPGVALTIDATIVRPVGDSLNVDNQARVSGSNFSAVLSDDPATAAVDDPTRFVTSSKPHLVVQKTAFDVTTGQPAGAGPIAPGDTIRYTITLENDGGRSADDVTVTDVVDARLVNVVAQDGGAFVAAGGGGGGIATWSIASLAIDAVATVRFTAVVQSPLANGSVIPNRASAALAEPGVPGAPFLSDDPGTAAPNDPTVIQIVSTSDFAATTLQTFDASGGGLPFGAPVTRARPGDPVRYGLLVQNRGTDDGRDVVVTLALPPEVNLVSAPGASVSGGTITWTRTTTPALADVAPGAANAVPLTVDVTLKSPLTVTQAVRAQASVQPAGAAAAFTSDDPSTAASGDPTLLDVVGLVVTKDAGASRLHAPGDVVTYTLTLTAPGNVGVGASTISDVIPATLENVVPGPGLTFDAATHTIRGTVGGVASQGSVVRTYTAQVVAAVANGTPIANQAAIANVDVGDMPSDDPLTAAALDPTIITIDARPILATSTKVATDLDGAPLLPGDDVRYVVTVKNTGTGSAADVRVVDALDEHLSVVTVENGGNNAGNTVVWDASTTPALALVARGATVTLAFTAKVSAATPDGTDIANQAALITRDIAGQTPTDDPSTAAPGDATVVRVSAPRLTVTKRFVDQTAHTGGGSDVFPADDIEYDIVVTNEGGVAATGVIVSDALPPLGLVDVRALDGGTNDEGLVTWTLPQIAAGASVTVRVRAKVDPLATGGTRLENRAEVTANEVGAAVRSDDPDTAAPDDATVRVVTASEQWRGTVEVFDVDTGAPILTPVVPGQKIRARLTFENDGNQTAQAVVLRVPLEPLRLVADSTTAGGVIEPGGVAVRWDASQNAAFTQMATGQGATVEFTATIATPLPDDVDIPIAGLITTVAVPAPPAIIGPAVLHTKSRPDLSATTKEVVDDDGGLVEPGDVLTYRITVLNDGGADAKNVVVVDAVPGGTVYVAGSTRVRGVPVPDAGAGVPPAQAGLAVGDLAAGRSVVVEMKARVSPQAPRGVRIDNQAVLRASAAGSGGALTSVPDAVSDNPATPLIIGDPTAVVVGGGASLVAQKVASPAPVPLRGELRFDIHVENVGTEPALDVDVDDLAPRGTHYKAGSLLVDGIPATDAVDRDDADSDEGAGPGGATALHAHRALLEAGEGFTFSFTVVVDSGTSVRNQATVTSSNAGTTVTDGDASVPGAQPTVVPVKDTRALVIDPDTVRLVDEDGGILNAGDRVIVRATVKNRSLEHVHLDSVDVGVSALLVVDGAAVAAADPRLVFDAGSRSVHLADGAGVIDIEDGGALDVAFPARVSPDARVGDGVRAIGAARVSSADGALHASANLGRAALTVGLLPGTAAIEGTLFLDGTDDKGTQPDHDGVFEPETDERVRGMTVLAFWRDDTEPVMSAVSDGKGHYELLPVPAGRYRLELRTAGGASFGSVAARELASGEVREADIPVVATGAVYVTGTQKAAEGARVQLFVDDGDDDPGNDVLVSERALADGQQAQVIGAQGLYRFDPPPGRYRIAIDTPDALLAFPSSSVPVTPDPSNANPFGALAQKEDDGDVAGVVGALPPSLRSHGANASASAATTYFLRFSVPDVDAPPLQKNFIPVDALKAQLVLTKTANNKRASIGDIVGYTVRVENRALSGVTAREGGVEIVDTLPFGFKLVDGSYQLDKIETDDKGQQKRSIVAGVKDRGASAHVFGSFELQPRTSYELRYNVVVGPGTTLGKHENRAALRLAAGQVPLTADATAAVQVVPDGIFDLGTVRAKVFCDDDGDGWQDEGEPGLPGVRLVADTGQWIDTDVTGKAHFSAIPAGMHLVKIDDRTLPPGTTSRLRETFYMSEGMPAQIEFGARCAFVKSDKVELVVNEGAYAPDESEKPVKHHVEGSASPMKLVVDGAVVDIPRVDLGLAVEGSDPAFAGAPGPNLPAVVDGALRPRLTLVPRVEGGTEPLAWELRIEALGLPAPSRSSSSSSTVDVDALAQPRTVWMFAGRGAPPEKIDYDGKDPSLGSEVLFEHQLYRATLTVGFADGARASSAQRVFGVRAGVPVEEVAEAERFEIDSDGGELFTAAGKPTTKLKGWLGGHAGALSGRKLTVVVHSDVEGSQAVTAQRAAAAKQALVGFGLDPKNVEIKGAGSGSPKVPNIRRRDHLTNRRVELVVEKKGGDAKVPALAKPAAVASSASVDGKGVGSDQSFATDVEVARGDAFAIDLVSNTGARLSVVRSDVTVEKPKEEAAPAARSVAWSPAKNSLVLDDREVSTSLLAARIASATTSEIQIALPPLDVTSWTVRIFAEKESAPVYADDDSAIGVVVRELGGEGKPPGKLAWDGLDADGKKLEGKLRARLIVKDARGDVGISPDVALTAAATAPVKAGSALEPVTIADPVEGGGALTPDAVEKLKALAAANKDAASVKIEVHTDNTGSQIARRTRTQNAATAMKELFVAAGVPADRIKAVGKSSDVPLVPNVGKKMRAQNRRALITIVGAAPAPVEPAAVVALAEPRLRANGVDLAEKDGALSGSVPAMQGGETVLDLRDAAGARATLHVRPRGAEELWQGDALAYDAWVAQVAPLDVAPASEGSGRGDVVGGGGVAASEGSGRGDGPPAWMPAPSAVPAHDLVVELPADTSALHASTLLVRGHTAPGNTVRIGADDVAVDDAGNFVHVAKLAEGDSDLVIEARDPIGNIARVKRPVFVDTNGWFALLLADTAFGGDGANLGERTPFTSVKLGDTFLYGRGAAFVQGRWAGPWMFRHYDLTLDVDTRRWQDDVFDPELIDPERFYPTYGDSSVENVDATRSAFPLYLQLNADTSSVTVGNVRTDLQGASLFRYQRARSGAQLVFDRGWTTPVELDKNAVVAPPENDPFRTTVTTFVAGGGGQRHARVELLGTGSSVYFLRHERVVEGSEQVAVIVRDSVTGAEVSRVPQVRDVDYSIRYDQGRVMFKEPVGGFTDGTDGLIVNHNLGQVANNDRVFVEVEYEHQDDDPFMGVGAGAQLKQRVLGHAEVGGGYVYEAREGGALGYQLGGGHVRLYVDDNTWIQAELLGSQSVDAGNFVSFDGGLTYSSLGQSLDQKDGRIGRQIYSADRAGLAFKLDGNAQVGAYLGRNNNADANVHAYVQQLQPGFFADASIVEQGQTKWGADASWRVIDDGKLKLRYDGVISEIPEVQPLTEFRELHREIATVHYEHHVLQPLVVSGEYGFGYTHDSGSFGESAIAQSPPDVFTNVVALGVDWQLLDSVELAVKQEIMLSGDPNQLAGPLDYFISHLAVKYALTDELSAVAGTDLRWSGENQEHVGLSYAINKTARVYASERVGVLPAPVTGTMGFASTTVVGGASDIAPGSTAYAEYQLDGGFSGEQNRGVVGLKTAYRLPFGFALNFGYERVMLIGGAVTPNAANGNIPPGAFTDGTFYAAPGANAGGAFIAGEGSRDAVSAGVELKRGEAVVASQRFELRYDNQTEARGAHDTLWMLSGSAAAVRLSPELSLLARYNVALAEDLALSARAAYFEEGAFGVAYRPVTHDWLSVLAKLSRRVDDRPLSLEAGTSDDYVAHALSIEPIVELPWKVQLVEKLALKHASERLGDVPAADAVTGLWLNRVNLHTLGLLHTLGVDTPIPGEIDLGLEYRVLAGFTYGSLEQGPLVELQVAPVEYFRVGVGYNFTRFSDDELDSGKIDRSGFFVRAVGSF